MIMILSVTDLIVGLICNPLFAAMLLKEYSSRKTDCLFQDIKIFCCFLVGVFIQNSGCHELGTLRCNIPPIVSSNESDSKTCNEMFGF